MHRNRKLMVAGAAATAAIAGSGAGVAIAASSASTHTLKFNSVEKAQKSFGYHFVDSDKDVKNGKTIGYDITDGVYNPTTKTFTLHFAGALKGGIIYGEGKGSGSGPFTGKVTGGTGKYKGITGTITGTAYGSNDDNEHLTITYH